MFIKEMAGTILIKIDLISQYVLISFDGFTGYQLPGRLVAYVQENVFLGPVWEIIHDSREYRRTAVEKQRLSALSTWS